MYGHEQDMQKAHLPKRLIQNISKNNSADPNVPFYVST